MPQEIVLPLAARIVRAALRSRIRGRTHVARFLARRLNSLQAVPIAIKGLPPVYIDLRAGNTNGLLMGSPWEVYPHEADEQSVISRIVTPGSVAFDVGANIGLYTVLLSKLVGAGGRVCAFEPNTEVLPALRRTVGGLSNVSLHATALSDRTQESTLFVPENNLCASLGDWTGDTGGRRVREFPCVNDRLDDLVGRKIVPRPDFIKCDVEGAELLVFRGARDTLDRADAPIILFEVDNQTVRGLGLSASAARDFLATLEAPRYHFFTVRPGGVLEKCEAVPAGHSNLLAVPASKIGLL